MNKQAAGLLGLAYVAGKVILGDEILEGLRKSQIKLVLIASDASPRTIKKWQDKCHFYQITCQMTASKEGLGRALGKGYLSAVALSDKRLADKFENLMKDGDIYGTEQKKSSTK